MIEGTLQSTDLPVPSDHYRPSIDGLRAVAVISVLLFHLNRGWLPGGFVGVDVFFAISGYLISLILLRSGKGRPFSARRFYQRRIARLLPAFVACALSTIAAAYLIYSEQDLASAGASLAAASAYVANLKFLVQGNYFALSPDAQPFLHCWSLAVEEQFYLLFPAVFLALRARASRQVVAILGALCLGSLVASVIITNRNPTWAFYLLPTRAWEFLAGSLVALWCGARDEAVAGWRPPRWLSAVGLALLGVSVLVIREGPAFPGYRAGLPVAATLGILASSGSVSTAADRLLASRPLVQVGRMSYSLYLWHWPIFSFVDYKLYLGSSTLRLILKVALTLIASAASFAAVESPARAFLSRRDKRGAALGLLAASLLVLVPLGTAVRKSSYINVEAGDVARGGIVYGAQATNGTVVLMGDSHASMYGVALRRMTSDLGARLIVVSVAAGDPLPGPSAAPEDHPLWNATRAVVQRQHPDVVVFVCNWRAKLDGDPSRLSRAVTALRQSARHVVLITQPPELPDGSTRKDIREGRRPPFWETPSVRRQRQFANAFVQDLSAADGVTVVDIEQQFQTPDGRIRLKDAAEHDLYQDRDHLSGWGAALVVRTLRDPLLAALAR